MAKPCPGIVGESVNWVGPSTMLIITSRDNHVLGLRVFLGMAGFPVARRTREPSLWDSPWKNATVNFPHEKSVMSVTEQSRIPASQN